MRFAAWTLSAVLFAGTLFAQQDPPQGPRGAGRPAFQELKTYLNLSDTQVANLKAVEIALREAIRPLLQDLAAKRQALRAENEKAAPDQNVITQLKQEIENLLGQIQTQRANYQKQALTYLNADQLSLLDKLSQALQLAPVARAAAALDLITPPEGAGFRMPAAGMRPGVRMRRSPSK